MLPDLNVELDETRGASGQGALMPATQDIGAEAAVRTPTTAVSKEVGRSNGRDQTDRSVAANRLPDVQNEIDERGIALNRVGVRGLRYPATVRLRPEIEQRTVGRFDLMTQLHHRQRGAHLSSLVSALEDRRDLTIGVPELLSIARAITESQTERGFAPTRSEVSVAFQCFVDKSAPVSGVRSLVAYDCGMAVELSGDCALARVSVVVPVATVCPCSLRISNVGAHNQRAHVSVDVVGNADEEGPWIQELIACIETTASGQMYGVLKRVDEKYVTEAMFSHATFVEDVVRNAVLSVRELHASSSIRVSCESMESIHAHNAYAEFCDGSMRMVGATCS